MRTYSEYKDSGVEWIGKIPKEWDHVRLKYLSNIKTGDKNTEDAEEEGEFPFFVRSQTVEKISTYSFDGEAILTAGDGVGVGKVFHYLDGRFDYHQRVYKFSDFYRVSGKFLFYYMKENLFNELLRWNAKSTVDSVRLPFLQNFMVPLPPLPEQKLISRYLDKKTEQIDRLVEKIQKKIELLKEQRTSLINQCVTKGLDPNVEMKDSGVEWIGEIPKHWDITKLKYLCPEGVQYGLNIESDSYKEIGVRFLRITDINSDGTLKSSGGVFLPEENVPREYLLNKNDILFSRSGGTVGKSTRISSTDHRMSFAGYLVRFSFQDEEISRFVKWVSESGIYWSWINLQIIQSTIQNVNGEKYANFSFSVPSHSEISNINDFLDEKTLKVDETINKHERKIHLLSEYRQSLISSVVTGKVRVTEDMI